MTESLHSGNWISCCVTIVFSPLADSGMSASAFVPLVKSGRIPKLARKEKTGEQEGGSLVQVLGAREVDILHR